MGMGLERIVKTRTFRACMAGLAALTLTAGVYSYSILLTANAVRTSLAREVYLNYVTTDAINDQIAEFLNHDFLWERLEPDYTDYSTLELVDKENDFVHEAVELDRDDSIREIDPFSDKHKIECKEHAFLTYKGLDILFKEHPELRHHLKNIRMVVGFADYGKVKVGHAWLEVKVDDEWQIYDTLNTFYNQPEWRDKAAYYPWVHYTMRDNGSIEKTVHPLNIFIHPFDFTRYAFNGLEERLDKEILDMPFTNFVDDLVIFPVLPLAAYGLAEYSWAVIKFHKKVLDKTR